ncbi:hypothetical protein BD779DRAFT_1508634 [Infundibulicybe gibba]|nr:hypothetical protein BD779DRAFT_1508634 [Infundibulicybe gibba]
MFSSHPIPQSTPFNRTPTPIQDDPGFDKSTITELVAQYGSSSATAWLEFSRYKIWRPSQEIKHSSFIPVQGYMQRDPFIFAWGNPLVSSVEALEPTARAFISWVESQGLRPVWACVDRELEQILAQQPYHWNTMSCIYEDVIDPAHLIDLTSPGAEGTAAASAAKDLKKNLRRAEREEVSIREIKHDGWTDAEKGQVESGISCWKAKKSKSGPQIASTTAEPWTDFKHRRYWVAEKDSKIVGLIILTPIQPKAWQIKNAISFPDAPKGTSEQLIYTALTDLHKEGEQHNDPAVKNGRTEDDDRIYVTFGISAADTVEPVNNLGGWKVKALSKMYGNVAKGAGLLGRGEFRNKFDSNHEAMYVCYPEDGLGFDGMNSLLKLLRK